MTQHDHMGHTIDFVFDSTCGVRILPGKKLMFAVLRRILKVSSILLAQSDFSGVYRSAQ